MDPPMVPQVDPHHSDRAGRLSRRADSVRWADKRYHHPVMIRVRAPVSQPNPRRSPYRIDDLVYYILSAAFAEVGNALHQSGHYSPMSDLILTNARIRTLDTHTPLAEAVAIKSGHISAVGTNAAVLNLSSAETRIVNMEGKTILPGFHDAHCHVLSFGMTLSMVPLGSRDVKSVADIVQRLSDRAGRLDDSPASWVIGQGYDQNTLSERRHPTRQDLDSVRPASHVLITHASGHAVCVNSRVLLQAGITKDTPDPSGGTIVRDAHGEPTGVLLENAILLAHSVVPSAKISEKADAIRRAAQSLSALGITSACDAALELADIPAYRQAMSDQPAVRLTLMPLLQSLAQSEGQLLSRRDLLEQDDSPWLQIGPAKLFVDGAISTRTAWLRAAYADQSDNCGTAIWDPAELEARVLAAHSAGWQVAAHAIGDAAIDSCLNSFGKAQSRHPCPDARHRIEHAMLLWPDQIGRMARLNVLPVFQPEFITEFGDTYIKSIRTHPCRPPDALSRCP